MTLRPIPLRPLRFFDGACIVELTQGYVAFVDAADAYLIADYSWHARACSKGRVYAVTNAITDDSGKRSPIQMHRVITDAPAGRIVDHRDGDGLNNRRANLRVATQKENTWNTGPRRNSSSGVKGVHWCKRDRRWIAQIMKDGVAYRLGSFVDLEPARLAYIAAAKELHGEFQWGAENGVVWSDPTQKSEAA